MKKIYAGIGSRETPIEVRKTMTEIASNLSRHGFLLRSGGAEGADDAFESGATLKNIFLPWDSFNGRKADGKEYIIPKTDFSFVEKFHPAPHALKRGAKLLMSRNTNQILGEHFDDPVDFVLCWTSDGKASGGTGQALRIAKSLNIPIFNFKNGYADFSTFITFQLTMFS